ncbi:MAG TPA: hypothetical protein VFZ58_02340 [Candidatus Saccharimonadales bacterium]
MYHSRKSRQTYKSYPKVKACSFCNENELAVIIKQTLHARVIENRVSYDLWDLQGVTDHLMVLPKRHVSSLAELNETERLDLINLIAEYESKGYSVYARAPLSPTRSQPHQHTHLIKTNKKLVRASFYISKPYISIKF